MRLLFLSTWFPSPPINGAKLRINNLLTYLTANHDVDLFTYVNTLDPAIVERELPMWQQRCVNVNTVPLPAFDDTRAKLGYFSKYPRHLVARHDAKLEQSLREILKASQYDAVITSEVGPASGISYYSGRLASEMNAPQVLDCLEVGTYLNAIDPTLPLSKRLPRTFTWRKTKAYLQTLLQKFALTTVPSDLEKQIIADIVDQDVVVETVPHSLDLSRLTFSEQSAQAAETLVYSGSLTYAPNKEAVVWFLEEIFPSILVKRPNVTLKVLGATADLDVAYWESRRPVKFIGLVEDVRPFIWEASVNIVSLLSGSGTRLKIMESLALGTPIVSTAKGAEGLLITPEAHYLQANTAADFANSVLRLLSDADLHSTLRSAGRQVVEEKYERDAVGKQFETLLERVVTT